MTLRPVVVFLVPCMLSLGLAWAGAADDTPSETDDRKDGFDTNSRKRAATLPPGFYEENAASGATFDTPVGLAFAPDGRIFVAEKPGKVYIIQNGLKLTTPFIDLETEVLNHWDRGLLGLELDPDFANNGYVYLMYTVDHDGAGDIARFDVFGRITRYTVSAADSNLADLSSRHILLGDTFSEGVPCCYYSHAIGSLRFGSDGTLLASTGDGASFNEVDPGGIIYPECFGSGRIPLDQDVGAFRSLYLGSPGGKILRIDPATGQGLASNPFYTGDPDDVQSKIWAYGLRNPYRFSVLRDGSSDPADGMPGKLYIGDVGFNTWEELNVSKTGGECFGWPCYEGPNPHGGYQAQTPTHSGCATLTAPVTFPQFRFDHGSGGGSVPQGFPANAIIGGDFYEGDRYPASYKGQVFYADYTRGWLASARVDTLGNLISHTQFSPDLGAVVDVRYDPLSQYLYYVIIDTGQVFRLRHVDENSAPLASASASVTEGYAPLTVQFTGSDSFDPNGDPMTFRWDFDNGDTTSVPDPQYTFTADGTYLVTLTVTDENLAWAQTQLTITVGNTSPIAELLSPVDGIAVPVGFDLPLFASASDADQSAASLSYEWTLVQQHGDHDHPDVFNATGPSAFFTVPAHGLLNEVNFLKVTLIVTDSGGLFDQQTRYIRVLKDEETDVTFFGTPIALVTNPLQGNPNLEVIGNGAGGTPGTTDPMIQYITDDGQTKTEDWIGYQFPTPRYFSRISFQEGMELPTGGWFEDVRPQVRVAGAWEDVDYFASIVPYRGLDGTGYDTYEFLFEAKIGDAVRVTGTPGGSGTFITVAEMRVFEIPRADFVATPLNGASPLTVDFYDTSNRPGTAWFWEFGDGATSTQETPRHTYLAPGSYSVTLALTTAEGVLYEQKNDYIEVDLLDFAFFDFSDVSALQMNGSAAQSDAVLRLNADTAGQAGSAFLTTAVPVDAQTSFTTDFRFRMHGSLTNGADGMTFMVSGNGPTSLGASGGSLGFGGVGSSLAVELDIWDNGDDDPDGNHVGVDQDGSMVSLATGSVAFNLEDAMTHRMWVQYDGALDRLEVFVSEDPGIQPSSPIITVNSLQLDQIVGSEAYFGFSAGTGGYYKIHDIESWTLQVASGGAAGGPGNAPAIASFSPTSGMPGTTVVISGGGFTGATSVTLAGIPMATYQVTSPGQIHADVPIGAESGVLEVQTPLGIDNSVAAFTVTDRNHLALDLTDFASAKNLVTAGTASTGAGPLRLTDDAVGQAGAAYYAGELPLTATSSFSTWIQFRLHGSQPDAEAGFTFLLQGQGPTALGPAGAGLGYDGITSSLAIEVDVHADLDDPDGNHLGVDVGGSTVSAPVAAAVFDLEDGQTHTAWVDYDGATDELRVYVAESAEPSAKPQGPLMTVTSLDLLATVGPTAYVGFTGGTGSVGKIQDIEAWHFELTNPDGTPTAVEGPVVARSYRLGAPHPNPFNPRTVVQYDVSTDSHVRLRVFNAAGRVVRTLVDGRQSAGTKTIQWTGDDDRGHPISSGVYYLRMEAPGFNGVRKVMLLK